MYNAADYGGQGKFAAADALIEENECTWVSFVAIRQYASDPAGAERLLRRRSNPDDLLFGLDQLAIEAARKGNITEAFRFLSDLQSLKDGNPRNSVLGKPESRMRFMELRATGPERMVRR